MSDADASLTVETADTARLTMQYRRGGDPGGDPVVLLHGNVSSSRFWEPMVHHLPDGLELLAPDMRGYGETDREPVDATAGLAPFAADLRAFLDAVDVTEPTLVGWSMGGGIAMRYAIEHPTDVAGLALVNPLSPYGFGGTDREGTPCQPDHAGTGAGLTDEDFVERLGAGDRSAQAEGSPRSVLRAFYVADPDAVAPAHEDAYVDGMVAMATGDDHYPGDAVPSEHWPGVAPGEGGVNNAMSPKYCDLTDVVEVDPKPPILWLRGAADQIVSDASLFEAGTLGQLGELPDYPGEDVYPPQPMVTQTQDVLEDYEAAGGDVETVVFESCGHGPHLERPAAFARALGGFLT